MSFRPVKEDRFDPKEEHTHPPPNKKTTLKQIYNSKWFEPILTILCLLPVCFSVIKIPFTHDVRMYHAAAKLSEFYSPFPTSLDLAWEIKPIGSRFIHYVMYKVASIFATFGTTEYEAVVKVLAVLLVLAACWYFSKMFRTRFVFFITALALLTPYNQMILQPDWFAVIFSLVAIRLLIEESSYHHYLAGLVITFIFLLKGITILLVIPILLAVWIYERPDDMLKRMFTAGAASALSLIALLAANWFPRLIPDMLMSARLARIGYFGIPTMIQNFVYGFFSCYAAIYIPALLVGAACLIWMRLDPEASSSKPNRDIMLLAALWASCLFIVFCQSENTFVYQYAVVILASIVTMSLMREQWLLACVVGMLVIFAIFCAYGISANAQIEQTYTDQQQSRFNNMTAALPDLQHQKSVLYLDIGDAPYFLKANSTCRYINSLPFQRNAERWNISDLSQYQENYKCIMDYNGKYIITANLWYMDGYDIWWRENTTDNRNAMNKIDSEYTEVWNQSWIVYERNS